MKVVLFCGGLGTRLGEYSETIPKPMVDIGYIKGITSRNISLNITNACLMILSMKKVERKSTFIIMISRIGRSPLWIPG